MRGRAGREKVAPMTAITRREGTAKTDSEDKGGQIATTQESQPVDSPEQRRSTGADVLRFAGTWDGDDFEDCLAAVIASRSQARF